VLPVDGQVHAHGVELAGQTIRALGGEHIGTDVSDWTVSSGQAGGGMYATIADLGTWAPGPGPVCAPAADPPQVNSGQGPSQEGVGLGLAIDLASPA